MKTYFCPVCDEEKKSFDILEIGNENFEIKICKKCLETISEDDLIDLIIKMEKMRNIENEFISKMMPSHCLVNFDRLIKF